MNTKPETGWKVEATTSLWAAIQGQEAGDTVKQVVSGGLIEKVWFKPRPEGGEDFKQIPKGREFLTERNAKN